MGIKKIAGSFVAGILMTIILVVLVPVLMDHFLSGYISDAVGDNEFLFLTSENLSSVISWAVMLCFSIILGAGGILRKCGVFGIIGLVVAYWLMGDVTDAYVPLLILCATMLVSWIYHKKKEQKGEQKKGESE